MVQGGGGQGYTTHARDGALCRGQGDVQGAGGALSESLGHLQAVAAARRQEQGVLQLRATDCYKINTQRVLAL